MELTREPLSVGILGCADIAWRRAIPALRAAAGMRLAAVASRSREKAERFAARGGCDAVVGYQALLDRRDIDAVYLPLPIGLHEEWVGKAVAAGKHVLVEKSFAPDLGSAERMLAGARSRGVLLMENLMFLYHPQLAAVKAAVAEGAIGEVRVVRTAFGFPPLDPANHRYVRELGGGALLDAGAYTVRAASEFLGGLVVRGSHLATDAATGVDFQGSALLVGKEGGVAQVAFGFDNFYQCSCVIWGSKGRIEMKRAFTPGPDHAPEVILETPQGRRQLSVPAADHFKESFEHFAAAVRSGEFEAHHRSILEQARLLDGIRRGPRA